MYELTPWAKCFVSRRHDSLSNFSARECHHHPIIHHPLPIPINEIRLVPSPTSHTDKLIDGQTDKQETHPRQRQKNNLADVAPVLVKRVRVPTYVIATNFIASEHHHSKSYGAFLLKFHSCTHLLLYNSTVLRKNLWVNGILCCPINSKELYE